MAANLTVRYTEGVAVMDLSGRITLGDATGDLHGKMRDLIAEGHSKILLNLAGVNFMDSAGIGELASGHVSINHKHGRMKLCGLTKRIRDLLQVTRLYNVLDICESEEDALQSFR